MILPYICVIRAVPFTITCSYTDSPPRTDLTRIVVVERYNGDVHCGTVKSAKADPRMHALE